MPATAERAPTLQGLERGLAVIQAFSDDAPTMTLSEVARRVDISRATARRILLTLEQLGFVGSDGRRFSLAPGVLRLGWSYLASLDRWDMARPFMEDLAEEAHETASATTLELPDIVFVARVPARGQIMTMSLGVGSRLPAYATAMGRVLLAELDDDEVSRYLERVELVPLTASTVTEADAILEIVRTVRRDGFAAVDEELEQGLRSISVPLRTRGGQTLAALNVCAATSRVGAEEMHSRMLPLMRRTAAAISGAWSHHSAG